MLTAQLLPGVRVSASGTVLGFLCLSTVLRAAPEFSGYLKKVLKNHTAHACDGEQLGVTCPHRTTISILSAFYGRRIPSQNLCPGPGGSARESTNCLSVTAQQKLLDECQDQQWCHFSVNSRVFGPDPCPGTHKYLIVSYKCRPENHRTKTVCENDKLRLQCRNSSVLAIYSASYGRFLEGKSECDSKNQTMPDIECLAPGALRRVSKKCHRKENCTIFADMATFGNPCFPGVKKQLRVSYVCVPKQLLQQVDLESPDPFSLSDYTHGGWYKGPRVFKLHEDVVIVTSSLELLVHIWGMPEKLGLYFLCGVSAGLVFLLCVFAPKMAFIQDVKEAFWDLKIGGESKLGGTKLQDQEEDDNHNDDSSSDSSFRRLTRIYRASDNIFGPELTAALEGAAEERGQEGDEIWMPKESSPYAIHKIKSATK
ncbi:protein eva-1 homolog C-like isoform X1 [Ornithorhynchus anatinus]|uniref:SUEL-type lectin domain-containing protein n=1 Tax=Ornithorhynchus anatinus TaxID=9258 RepID=F6Z742_ORNAN|nr:protein eva-1 homolog C-like isoform X1 [Ornithorhynchus anatinus]